MLPWGLFTATDTATLFDMIAGLHQAKIKCWANHSCRASKLNLQTTADYYVLYCDILQTILTNKTKLHFILARVHTFWVGFRYNGQQ